MLPLFAVAFLSDEYYFNSYERKSQALFFDFLFFFSPLFDEMNRFAVETYFQGLMW